MKTILFNIKKVLTYTTITILVSSLTYGSLYVGYKQGETNITKKYHTLLIEKGFAHYNETNGQWEFKKTEVLPTKTSDILENGMVFYNNDDIIHPIVNKKVAKNK